ncbi:Phage P22-like portal protein [uncultured Caudovirales phage]|uniref:Phage P22-like portal protein n=1 Tax=uncultured Caudovirales phage TaxID=2100421 RepID=A0A6J5RQJ4_9CAUD|nr:Phage P22-like portal protein [uncultured Caudovirales phage]CAB4199630.1 Phage P22-like portal protein [uncultured Caudovirales phage]
MARPTKEQRLAAIHQEALAEFDNIQSALRDERLQCLQDRRFYSIAGAQWEGPLGEQFENKPKFEVNKIHLAVIRIINEYRNNRITVDFVSKEGKEYDKLADTCDGLYRADEQDSGAEEAYDNAFEEGVAGGFGAWRLRTVYENEEDEEDEKQRIRIEPIFDADSSVFFDLNAKRQDKADAKRCFVITSMTRQAYKDEWGDDPASWPKEVHQYEFDWLTPDVVFVAEYYRVEETRETVYVWETLNGDEERYKDADFEADETLEERLLAVGSREVRQKNIKRRRVRKYILSGAKILEDCGHIAGKCIPIVPMYGKRWFVDNVERCMGHVRLAKDAQRLKNMQLSKLGEISALSPVEKPILTPEQVAGHQMMWADDNIKNYPYLLVNPITDANGQQAISGPIGYTKPPQIPQALAALLQITEQDMQDLLGNQQAGEELQPNISGKAVELVQNKLDMQTFIYMSNMSKAIKRSGEIWLSMARDVLVEEGRKMKSIGPQNEMQSVELAKPVVNDKGEIETENDLSQAEFDVNVDVGPSSSSKRAATVRALTGMASLTDDAETKQVLGAMAMMNMEGEGITEVRDYFRKKLLRLGVVKPTEEEQQAMADEQANQKPDPNTQYLQAAADEASANATQARAKTILTVAQADETKAKTMKTLSDVDSAEQRQAMEVIEKFGGLGQVQPQGAETVSQNGIPL